MSRADPQVNFRLPTELRERIKVHARAHRRSVTAEMIVLLELALAKQNAPTAGTVEAPTGVPQSKDYLDVECNRRSV